MLATKQSQPKVQSVFARLETYLSVRRRRIIAGIFIQVIVATAVALHFFGTDAIAWLSIWDTLSFIGIAAIPQAKSPRVLVRVAPSQTPVAPAVASGSGDADPRTDDTTIFGCKHCWPNEAEEAWAAQAALEGFARPLDESHFIVNLRRCPHCKQQFVSVFTEQIDWQGGDDPQRWAVMPLTASEAENLSRGDELATQSALNALTPKRRRLLRLHPKGSGFSTAWGFAPLVGPHD